MSTLGETLRERRAHLGITLEQAEAATRIRARILSSIENGAYDELPNAGYVRGFISSYARFLDLDPKPLLALYKAETGQSPRHDLVDLPQISEAVKPIGQQHALPAKGAIAAVLVVALLSLSVWAVGRIWRGPEPTPPVPVSTQETTTSTATTSGAASHATTTPAVSPSAQQPKTALPFTLDVAVAADGASWLRVTVDGKKAYEGTLTGGQSKSFEVADSATVLVGQPSVVTIRRDGKEVTIPDNGNTPTVTLKAQASK